MKTDDALNLGVMFGIIAAIITATALMLISILDNTHMETASECWAATQREECWEIVK